MTEITIANSVYRIQLDRAISLAMTLHPGGARAWYVGPMRIAPVLLPYVTGSVKLGGNVNFNAIEFNPHGHGTHTETVGHIAAEEYPICELNLPFFMTCEVVSIAPQQAVETRGWQQLGDTIITKVQLESVLGEKRPQSLVIRTLPNVQTKLTSNYSGTNFCYFEPEALGWLAQIGVEHLLVDLPSVDREEDGGELLAHRAFWQYPHAIRAKATITELIFVPDQTPDGTYILHLDWAPFHNDASPSRPTLFPVDRMA